MAHFSLQSQYIRITVGTTAAERTIFEVAIRKDIIMDVVRCIRHKRRQPHRVKRVGELRGSKRKPRYTKTVLDQTVK